MPDSCVSSTCLSDISYQVFETMKETTILFLFKSFHSARKGNVPFFPIVLVLICNTFCKKREHEFGLKAVFLKFLHSHFSFGLTFGSFEETLMLEKIEGRR